MRPRRSTTSDYGSIMVLLHWVSAAAILAMIPLGFLMQDVSEASKLALYRAHAVLGLLVLGLTLGRVVWKAFDARPAPPSGLSGAHLRGMQAIHALLYLVLLVLSVSGLVLIAQSGLLTVLRGSSGGPIPELAEFNARAGHAVLARVYIGLLIAHIGGVLLHQLRHGHVLDRMGIGHSSS